MKRCKEEPLESGMAYRIVRRTGRLDGKRGAIEGDG
jgi:hypothetical protein